jgi:type IV secretion system protein VirB9
VRRSLLAAALLLGAAAAPSSLGAQVRPHPVAGGDPHLQTVDYDPGQIVLLELSPGYQMTVELAPDEQVENIAVGDSGAWQVTANRRGDRLFIKPLQAGVSTNMTVITSVRLYAIQLAPLGDSTGNLAYVVRFQYPDPDKDAADGDIAVEGSYRLSGDRALRPGRISDDGRHTYIEWPKEAALPAVYGVDSEGQEVLVNGMMRGDLFVVDSVVQQLVFRIDRRVAKAVRVVPKGGR